MDSQIDRLNEENAILREALMDLFGVTSDLAARIMLGITVKRMQGKDAQADAEERDYITPWETVVDRVRPLLGITE